MKNRKIVPIVLVSISIVLFLVVIVILLNSNYLSNSNKNSEKESSSNNVEETETTEDKTESSTEKENNNETINNKEEVSSDTDKKEESNTQEEITNSDQEKDSTDSDETTQYTEEDVITYFSLKEKSVGTNQEDKSVREKAKESFVSIVDFIFYDKEIKGYTFDELTTNAKLKVIEIALSIDNKIDEYFPDYKETIKDKYTDIKGKLAVKYLEFTENLCNKVGTDVCNQAKEDFNTMKESFGFTWELIKELAKSGSSKVKEFYESWRDSE